MVTMTFNFVTLLIDVILGLFVGILASSLLHFAVLCLTSVGDLDFRKVGTQKSVALKNERKKEDADDE